jgi:hypothetical protein
MIAVSYRSAFAISLKSLFVEMVGRIKNATRVNCQKTIVELTQHHIGIKALLAVEKQGPKRNKIRMLG